MLHGCSSPAPSPILCAPHLDNASCKQHSLSSSATAAQRYCNHDARGKSKNKRVRCTAAAATALRQCLLVCSELHHYPHHAKSTLFITSAAQLQLLLQMCQHRSAHLRVNRMQKQKQVVYSMQLVALSSRHMVQAAQTAASRESIISHNAKTNLQRRMLWGRNSRCCTACSTGGTAHTTGSTDGTHLSIPPGKFHKEGKKASQAPLRRYCFGPTVHTLDSQHPDQHSLHTRLLITTPHKTSFVDTPSPSSQPRLFDSKPTLNSRTK